MGKSILRSTFRALGTQVDIQIVFGNEKQAKKAQKDIKKVEDIFFAKQKIFCRFDPKSELSKLNGNLGVWQKASPDMRYLAKRALFYNRESGGLYDPRIIETLEKIGYKSKTVTSFKEKTLGSGRLKNISLDLKVKRGKVFFARRMDFSGIAKGYIIDQAVRFLGRKGWKNFFINVNGDAYAAGFDSKSKRWKFPIEGARDKKAVVCISNQAVATSGVIKRRWRYKGKKVHHLINPKNPSKFSFTLRSVLVIHKKVEWADGRAKVLVLLGKKKGLAVARRKKLRAIFVDKRGKLRSTC